MPADTAYLSMTSIRNVVTQQAKRLENPKSAWFPELVGGAFELTAQRKWHKNELPELRRYVRETIRHLQRRAVANVRGDARKLANGDPDMTADLAQQAWLTALESGLDCPVRSSTTRGHMRTYLKQAICPVSVPTDQISRANFAAEPGEDIEMVHETDFLVKPTHGLGTEAAYGVRDCFYRLTPQHQQALRVYVVDEEGVGGVAHELGVSVGKAAGIVADALQSLRDVWNND